MTQEETEHLESQNLWGRSIFLYSKKKRREEVFSSYDENTKGFRIWLSEKGQIKIHRDVRFTEQHYKINQSQIS